MALRARVGQMDASPKSLRLGLFGVASRLEMIVLTG